MAAIAQAAPASARLPASPAGNQKAASALQASAAPAPAAFAPPTGPERLSAGFWKQFRAKAAESLNTEAPRPRRPGATTTIRVFISSTFVDEHGERDELVRRVFNELNAALRARWVQVVPVDLRWGVSHEETLVIQQTCLNEIDACRANPGEAPWFIGLRGERYGWVQVRAGCWIAVA
jgi:hypothetical protein